MTHYKRTPEFAHTLDDDILATLIVCEDIAQKDKIHFKLHPAEKQLVESYLTDPAKLDAFLGRHLGEQFRSEVLTWIWKVLNRPVVAEDES